MTDATGHTHSARGTAGLAGHAGPAHEHHGHHHGADACAAGCATAALPPATHFPRGPDEARLLLHIPAMDCPTEERQIRDLLEPSGGVRGLEFDLGARTLAVDAPADAWEEIDNALHGAGFETRRLEAPPSDAGVARARRAELRRLSAALAIAAVAELIHALAGPGLPWQLAGMAAAALAIALSGPLVLRKGVASLRRGRLDISALMSVAVVGAFLIGQWPEAAMVMALYSLAELIEARAAERARNAIRSLLALTPDRVTVLQPDGQWADRDPREVVVGTIARVRPGERLALDGRVVRGRGAVDQSPVTGESIPVDREPGDAVFAGSINQDGALEFEVTRQAGDTVLARIIATVEEARNVRAPTQRFVDRFAAIYTPIVFLAALVVVLGSPLVLGWSWSTAAYRALVLLVIACPCALVISTPVTVVSGLAAAARRGILVKGGAYLEQARRLEVVALDKTGTLTEGRPKLLARRVLAPARDEAAILDLAASLAGRSDHPVSTAVATGLGNRHWIPIEEFAAEPGRGVRGQVAGSEYVLGNHRWIHERGQCSPELEAVLEEEESRGRTVSLLADAQGPLALFAVADTPRPSSRRAVEELRALGVQPVMLTGDNPITARVVAAELGIEDVRAGLLPQDKQEAIATLARTRTVGMVGDGVNDSPGLAVASIGFSMGAAGTDMAREAADVLIMDDDLRKVPELVRLSQRTARVLGQNIVVALGIKAIFFVLAVLGSATMWMAVFADMGASLLVIFNGLRLLSTGRRGRG